MSELKAFVYCVVILIAMWLFLSSVAKADEQQFTFKYKLDGQTLEIKKKDDSWAKAFEFSAKECYKYFKDNRPLTEEKGIDIIDVCANPR